MMMGLVVFLAGCTQIKTPITAESTGIWNEFFVYPLSQVIIYFAGILKSYGLAIVVISVIIHIILLHINIKQLKSSKAIQEIQPELKELQKKYSSRHQATQQQLHQETMALFQKHG